MRESSPDGLAIVGIGCRFPGGASSPEEFWRLLCDGVDAIGEIPRDRFDVDAFFAPEPAPGSIYARYGGFVSSVDAFDAGFFALSPREARRIDPQHRLLLEVMWEALEDAGQPPRRLAGTRTGVFVGISSHDYGDIQLRPANRWLVDAHDFAAAAPYGAANRVSRLLDLHGPSVAVDTACSSSLTAVHLACMSLRAGECEVALVGGVNLILNPEPMISFCRGGVLSRDGRSKAFDARADGYVRGEGAGAIVLKSLRAALEAGDPVYAVIRGTAVSQDGRTPAAGIPSAEAQADMVLRALEDAGLDPGAVQYVEAHGTGTPTGDPIEAAALGRVLAPGRPPDRPCLVGSVKTNIGHLEAGAGIAGLIKTALALRHRLIPPSLHFRSPNPAIPLGELRLRVPTALEPWPAGDGPAVAGVNSFGFGGANAHAVLVEPPAGAPKGSRPTRSAYLLPVTARGEEALRQLAAGYARCIRAEPALRPADLCHTAAERRDHHEHRLAVVASDGEGLALALEAFAAQAHHAGATAGRAARDQAPRVAFVFSGMGPQWWGMGRQLQQEEPVFREALQECDRLLRPVSGWSLLEELGRGEEESRVAEAYLAHSANMALQLALVALWRSWGVEPAAVLGHSSGEMAAACAAGALDPRQALLLSFHRGRLQHRLTGKGRMLAATIPAEVALELVAPEAASVSLAAVNAPASVSLSGAAPALERIAAELQRRGVASRLLPVEVPYHSPFMETIREELLDALRELRPADTRIPFISAVAGRPIDGRELGAPYWYRNVREPVQFAAAVAGALHARCDVLLEVGPHPVLAASMRECVRAAGKGVPILATLRQGGGERAAMLRTLGALFVMGQRVDWRAVDGPGGHVTLPTYPWQRERCWLEQAPSDRAASPARGGASGEHLLLGARLRSPKPTWQVELGQAQLDFLEGHVVGDAPVLPAAAYVEMALSAARELQGEGPLELEELEFRHMLGLGARQRACVQVSLDPEGGALEVHASVGGAESAWTRYARARTAAVAPHGQLQRDVAALRGRCPTAVEAGAFYAELHRRGLRYSGAFTSVEALWRGEREALARVRLQQTSPAGVNGEGYEIHPALLDGAFQVVAAAGWADAADPDAGPLVPVSVERITFRKRPPDVVWAHAVVAQEATGSASARVTLLDDAGEVLLECEGLRARELPVAGTTAARAVQQHLYTFGWQERALARERGDVAAVAPSGSDGDGLASAPSSPVLPGGLVSWDVDAHFLAEVEPRLDALALAMAGSALRALGWEPPVPGERGEADLPGRLGVAPRHHRLFRRLAELVATAQPAPGVTPDPARLADDVLRRAPAYAAEVQLIQRCGGPLADVLRGKVDPLELLMADLELLRRFYGESPIMRFHNELAAQTVEAAIARASGQVRVIEIGAGTGGLTRALLPRLREHPFEYALTDVSPFFLTRARERFRDEPAIRPTLLDIEADPFAQGFSARSFDVVVAANVMHATVDLRLALTHARQLLRPGGLLVLVEATRRAAWLDTVFGPMAGWWRFAERDARATHPLRDEAEWREHLSSAGFEGATAVGPSALAGKKAQSVLAGWAAGPPRTLASTSGGGPRWLLLADRRGVAAAVARELRARGHRCTLAHVPPAAPDRDPGGGLTSLQAELERLVAVEGKAGSGLAGILHFWSLDALALEDPSAGQVMESQLTICESVVALARALDRAPGAPPVWVVTAGGQDVERGEESPNPLQASAWGIARVLMSERPDAKARLVDLGASSAPDAIAALVAELTVGEAEDEIALRGRKRFVRRLQRLPATPGTRPGAAVPRSPGETPFVIEVATRGELDSIGLREVDPRAPGPGRVRIRARAGGLNFRNVLEALGMLPPDAEGGTGRAGSSECAGVVVACGEGVERVRPGDEVVALASTALGSHVEAWSELVVPKPGGLSFEEAATLPVAFLTAHYALDHLATVAPGDRVLVHAASGGVGLAALQICRRAGAEVFACAGSEEKRAFLRSLGVEHVLDSRSLAFAGEIRKLTRGEGVDVVLNSLGGEAIAAGLALLRPGGRFVEIGKRDINRDTPIGLAPFRKNLSFMALDLLRLAEERRAHVGALLGRIVGEVAEGTLRPLRHTSFDVGEAVAAYRLMAQARHLGKIVLTFHRDRYAVAPRAGPAIRSDATYLVTGGLGGFGLEVARWLVERGARHVTLMSRSAAPKEGGAALEALQRTAARVDVVQGDVAREEDVARVLATIRAGPAPLRGVFHAAMVLQDGPLAAMSREQLEATLSPKVAGAWNLHRFTRGDPLDHFVLFSSIASVIGSPMQGNYAAANAFLDALAPHRRALGLPALTVSWGALSGTGYVARHPDVHDYVQRIGLRFFTPQRALAALEHLLQLDHPHVVAADMDWSAVASWNRTTAASAPLLGATQPGPVGRSAGGAAPLLDQLRGADAARRGALLQERILSALAKVLGATSERLDPAKPLTELGLDSLLAVELLAGLRPDLPVQVGVVKLLQGMTAQELTTTLLEQLAPVLGSCTAAPVGEPAPEHRGGTNGTAHPTPPGAVPADGGSPPAGATAPTEAWPLAFEQGRIWFEARLAPDGAAYNLTGNARLSGRLDPAALRRALGEILRRHDVLRARFAEVDGEPRQLIPPWSEPSVPTVELEAVPAASRDAEVQRLADAEARHPFDLATGPLLRGTVLRLAPDDHVVLLTAHHIVVDAWGITVLVRELIAAYDALRAGRPSPLGDAAPRYLDYVRRQRRELAPERLEGHLAYWRRRLAGRSPELALPADRPAPAHRTSRGGHVRFEVPPAVSRALDALARAEGVTAFTALLAAFDALLHRYSGAEDLCVGTVVATRGGPGEDALVGCCMNTVALRADLSRDPTFRELLARVKEATLADLAHQDAPFERVVRALGESSPPCSPLFRAMFIMHNLRWPELAITGLEVRRFEAETGTALCDLMLLVDTGTPVRGTLEYSCDLFDAATVERIAQHLLTLLEGAVADADRRLSALPLLLQAERDVVNAAAAGPAVPLERTALLHALVEEQARRSPGALAVKDGAVALTYADLVEWAAVLAARLRVRGVGRRSAVAVCLPRRAELVAAALATLQAGGALVLLDPSLPPERLLAMVNDAGASMLLTSRVLRRKVRARIATILLDGVPGSRRDTRAVPDLAALPGDGLEPSPDDLAYIAFTSGTEGRPRGVPIHHRAIVNQVRWRQAALGIGREDVVLQRTPVGFDPVIWELFGPLAAGARLVMPAAGLDADAAAITRQVEEEGVTTLQVVPAVLTALLDDPGTERCRSLRRVLCGGEVLTRGLRERFFARLPWAELHNLYGPTETTIEATAWRCSPDDAGDSTPIGKPIANVRVRVLDPHMQPVPLGVPGELWIGGAGVARGYVGAPELSAGRFVDDPAGRPGEQLYRTGDRARLRADGALEFLGRRDDQVKLHGVRVEPGEIAAVLARHPGIRQTAVVARQDAGGGPRLVAYFAADPRDPSRVSGLQRWLRRFLPAAMMPQDFVQLPRLPLTAAGKLDTAALPPPRRPARSRASVCPRDELELRLAAIWEDLLSARVGVRDDFFAAGGHSLLAARLVARLRQEFGVELSLAQLLEDPTIEATARSIRRGRTPARLTAGQGPMLTLCRGGSLRPLFLVHGLTGDAVGYVDLARRLGGERPVHGLQAPALEGDEEPAERVEAIASCYVDALRAVQPEGPYLLGGWSMGGVLAYEMARQLGEGEVSVVLVLDAAPTRPDVLASRRAALAELVRRLLLDLGLDPSSGPPPDLAEGPAEVVLERLIEWARSRLLDAAPPLDELVRRRGRLAVAHAAALAAYRPRAYAGRLELIRAARGIGAGAEKGWRTLAGAGVGIHVVPGTHDTMLRPPHVAALARCVRGLLSAAELRQGVPRAAPTAASTAEAWP